MTDNREGMGAGVRWGSLAATSALVMQLPLLASEPLELGLVAPALPGMVVALLVTLAVTAAIVGVAALIIGLPVVTLLARLGCDGAEVLAPAGGLAGYGVVLAIFLANGEALDSVGLVLALSAMAGGAVLGAVWGHARDKREQEEAGCGAPAANRVHDRRWLR
jgi:hypothetical protein